MGSKQIGPFVIFLICLPFFASSSPLHYKIFVSDFLKEHNLGQEGDGNGRNGIVHSTKFVRGGATGGHPSGEAESGNGNGNGQGGTAVIPIVVAGAANNHHAQSHHSAASCNRNCIRFPVMVMITFLTLTVHLCGLFG